jgi:hypothetical protein
MSCIMSDQLPVTGTGMFFFTTVSKNTPEAHPFSCPVHTRVSCYRVGFLAPGVWDGLLISILCQSLEFVIRYVHLVWCLDTDVTSAKS